MAESSSTKGVEDAFSNFYTEVSLFKFYLAIVW